MIPMSSRDGPWRRISRRIVPWWRPGVEGSRGGKASVSGSIYSKTSGGQTMMENEEPAACSPGGPVNLRPESWGSVKGRFRK
jgi:hypothetical protein